jgi:glycosyltransferase involved in cell wall biosynthesis
VLRNRIYYGLKPFIPQLLRTAIRRRVATRLRKRTADVWPIMPGSERPPENWPGWPKGKRFALVLTHDVESKAGLDKCRPLMQLELDLGFRSSFNFVPEGNYRVPAELREELTATRFEVGIHDLKHDGRLFASHREFKRRAVRINEYAREWGASGFRSGFMLRNLDWLHDLDVHYDASTFDTDPFEPQPEGGHTIFPFWVPRPTDGSINGQPSTINASSGGYVELPYTLPQDSTLFLVLRETTPEIWMRKLDWIAEHGGMVLLDAHPDYMSFGGSRQTATEYPVALYREFLTYIKTRYAGEYWHALPKEVAGYVNQIRSSRTSFREYDELASLKTRRLRGKRAAVLLFSHYPADPRPRRAAEALAAQGASIDLICLREGDDEPAHETYGNINVTRVRLKRYRGSKLDYAGRYAVFILTSFFYLASRSLMRRYDLVHVHNMPDVLVFAAVIPKLLGTKVILDLHDPMPELMQTIFKLPEHSFSVVVLKRLEKWSIRFADLVLTVNLACKEIYSSRSCQPHKINVVINSPDDEIFRFQSGDALAGHEKNGNGSKPFVILYHGSLVQRNGFDLALESLEKVMETIPSIRLRVCGKRTNFFEKVMESARQRGLDRNVDYLGVRNLKEIIEAIEDCDLGIIPNHRNIFTEINTPTRIFEYLALAKPVIAPKTKGIQDYFGDNDLIFFELGNADDLARKIEFAFSHPAAVAETVKRGQEVYLSHTWSRERLTLLNSISELLRYPVPRPSPLE